MSKLSKICKAILAGSIWYHERKNAARQRHIETLEGKIDGTGVLENIAKWEDEISQIEELIGNVQEQIDEKKAAWARLKG